MDQPLSTLRVEYMILANGAEAVSGHHYILGGGFDGIVAAAVPATHPRLSVALKVCVPYAATSSEHRFELAILDQDGQPVGDAFDGKFEAGRPVGMRPDDHQSLVIAFNFLNVQFNSYGGYSVVCRLDGSEEWRSSFKVNPSPVPLP